MAEATMTDIIRNCKKCHLDHGKAWDSKCKAIVTGNVTREKNQETHQGQVNSKEQTPNDATVNAQEPNTLELYNTLLKNSTKY